jgi:hypothetical protein
MKSKLTLRSLLPLSAAVWLALFSGCASGPTVRTDPDTSVKFENYTTFALIRPGRITPRDPEITPTLMRQTRDEVEAAFVAKGLTKVPHPSAELFILVHGGLEEKINVTDWGYSTGRFSRGFAGRGGAYELNQYKEGTLLIDVIDAKTRELLWRGSAVAELSETPGAETVKNAVATIVSRYPN